MLPMSSAAVRARLVPVLRKAGLPTAATFDREAVWRAMLHDKKASADGIDIITVDTIGSGQIERVTLRQLRERLDAAFKED